MNVVVKEEWRFVDRWWTDDPIHIQWVEAIWYDREIIFYQRDPDPVWRIWKERTK
jgi:hypothetical protein